MSSSLAFFKVSESTSIATSRGVSGRLSETISVGNVRKSSMRTGERMSIDFDTILKIAAVTTFMLCCIIFLFFDDGRSI